MTVAALPARAIFGTSQSTDSPQATAPKIRTLIVDDQVIEREVMRRLLKSEPDIEILDTFVNGREAVDAIKRLKPDLVFLDVQMPELDGFGVVSKLDPAQMPVIVFVTANEEFARRAFDVQALDYLIKPCQRDRLKIALQRVRRQLQFRNSVESKPNCPPQQSEIKSPVMHPDRIAVKTDGRILLIRHADINWIEADDNYVKLHAGGVAHSVRETLSSMELRLPADRFIRISRSAMVNVECIRELEPLMHGEYAVMLQDGTRLTLTRNHRDRLQQLGL